MSETETIERRLHSFLAAPDDADWQDVLRRAGPSSARRRWRPVLAAAVAAAALAGAGVASAAGLGAFQGIGAAQHPPTAADIS